MEIGAVAIMIFHPPTEAQRFGAWVADTSTGPSKSTSTGSTTGLTAQPDRQPARRGSARPLASHRRSGPRQSRADCGVASCLRQGSRAACGRRRELPAAGVAVCLHDVAFGKESEFVAAQEDLAVHTAGLPGYEVTGVSAMAGSDRRRRAAYQPGRAAVVVLGYAALLLIFAFVG
jgi:hypothetical protein